MIKLLTLTNAITLMFCGCLWITMKEEQHNHHHYRKWYWQISHECSSLKKDNEKLTQSCVVVSPRF